ncbi:N-acetylglucosamine-6-phosphate deacetylase [Malacoplasma iowae]|uniref:N-acetylglucosamine-6-phosphate deacetylase n=1 Tax=Malacoplasma iowae TaxID=2116 RepID=UPI002A18D2CE|nr:N-acetylglucosamine-6-phosphate deacetylase [Malacoplasma iowae]WPL39107.1 N-acetylglucosamine-6-phosphate deacetylase [Malacoplasma iowae]WPL39876.1 N-acetylglucosamine-6-phosphate deacetylase [Malacoplasma iowae]
MRIIKNINIINHNDSFFGEIHINENIIEKVVKISDTINTSADYLLPAFVDGHTHGGYGLNFNDLDKVTQEEINEYKNQLFKEGVTNVAFTTITAPIENIYKLAEWYGKNYNDIFIAWHIEGPFISTMKKGAHEEKYINFASSEIISNIINFSQNKKIIITSALEEGNNFDSLINFTSDNFYISLGHSNATFKDVIKYYKNGVNRVTHLYNAMSAHNHREPGIVNAVFALNGIYAELIADGHHIDNNVILETIKILGFNRIMVVSDSLSVKGLNDGDYYYDGFNITKKGKICYLQDSNTIAGSAFKYIDIIKHVKNISKCSLSDLVKISSYNFYKSIGLSNVYGSIAKNYIADLVIVDKNLNIKETIKNGISVYKEL